MKLYEVNQAIEDIFERMVDPDTGEIIGDDALMEELAALQMERGRILEYLAKLVLNNKANMYFFITYTLYGMKSFVLR